MLRPKAASETVFAYTNKFNKKSIQFQPKTDEVMATFQTQQTDTMALDILEVMRLTTLPLSQPNGINLNRAFAVFKVPNTSDITSVSDLLAKQPQIANTLPAMQDDEGLIRYFMPDEITVQFGEQVTQARAEQIIATQGCRTVKKQRTPNYYTILIPDGKGLFTTLQLFSAMPEVTFAEPSETSFTDQTLYLPTSLDFPKMWALHNTAQTVNGLTGRANCDIKASEAWELDRGDPKVIVTIVDTGVNTNHPGLTSNILPRGTEDWDFGDAVSVQPDDTEGHGTHVAGTAAAPERTSGSIGVAPGCKIMPLKIDLTTGMMQNRADALNYVTDQALKFPDRRYVVNCSWKIGGDHAGIHRAIQRGINNNIVIVFAAGNNNQNLDVTPEYPASYPEVLSVSATGPDDRKAFFSNYGSKVNVSAPGINIYSTYLNNGYTFLDGTSMAAPHVTGLAALVWSHNQSLSNRQVMQIVEENCDDINPANPGYAGKLGQGRINAFKAVSKVTSPAPPPAVVDNSKPDPAPIPVQVGSGTNSSPDAFRLMRQFPFPQKNNGSSTAICFVQKLNQGLNFNTALLFLTQQPYAEPIYYLEPQYGAVLAKIDPASNTTIGSLTWDGLNIRVANVTKGSGAINTIDPRTGLQLKSIVVPQGRGEGLAYDGTYLYYSIINVIYVIEPETGQVLRAFSPPGGDCITLAHGSNYLFSVNSRNVITIFDPKTLAVKKTITSPGGTNTSVAALAFNPCNDELFIADQSKNVIFVAQLTLQ